MSTEAQEQPAAVFWDKVYKLTWQHAGQGLVIGENSGFASPIGKLCRLNYAFGKS